MKRYSPNQIALALTLVALVVRLVGLGEHSYWYDEAHEIQRALTAWPQVLFVSEGADPPLYRLLLVPLTRLSLAEFWLRLPSALSSAAAVYLLFIWLSLLGLPAVGLLAAGLLAFSPVQIFYAQDVSQYALTVLLGLGLLIAAERVARRGAPLDWLLFSGVTVVALFTYYGLAWLLPAVVLHLALRLWQKGNRRQLAALGLYHLVALGAVGVLYLTMLNVHIERITTRKSLAPLLLRRTLWENLAALGRGFAGKFLHFFTLPWSPDVPDGFLLFFAVLLFIGSVYLWQLGTAGRRILIYTGATTLIMYLASGLGLYIFGHRYALFLTPLFFTPIAAGLLWLWRWRPAGAAATALLAVTFLFFWPNLRPLPNPWLQLPREHLRPVVNYVYEQARPGDVIYVYYGAVPAYDIYRRSHAYRTIYGPWFRAWPPQEKLAEIQEAVAGSQRFWLVMSHIAGTEAEQLTGLLAESSPSYKVINRYRTENAAAFLLQRDIISNDGMERDATRDAVTEEQHLSRTGFYGCRRAGRYRGHQGGGRATIPVAETGTPAGY